MLKKVSSKKFIDYIFIGVLTFFVGLILGGSTPIVKHYISTSVFRMQSKVAGLTHTGFYLPDSDFNLYWRVYKDLKNKYADKDKIENDKTLYYGSIRGMVASVGDPATIFLDPQETKKYQESLSPGYEGIGAQLDDSASGVYVVTVFDGSPAKKAGLRAGDIILKVNSKDVLGKPARELVNIIRGPANTKVTLTILRQIPNMKKLDINITRGKITIPSSSLIGIKNKIAIIRITRFTDTSYEQWAYNIHKVMKEVSDDILEGKVKGIIIDLRGNPGGFLESAVNLSSYFLKQGKVVSYLQTRKGIEAEYRVMARPEDVNIPGAIPVVILVDQASASASEIFSGAMQYYKRAVLVGTHTFGKGTVQRILAYPDGSTLHITIAHWLLPNKRKLTHDKPVQPDVSVEFDYNAKINKGVDTQLNKALSILDKKIIK